MFSLFLYIIYTGLFPWTLPWICQPAAPYLASITLNDLPSTRIVFFHFLGWCDDQCNGWSMKDAYQWFQSSKGIITPFLKPQIKPVAGNGHFMRLQSGVASMGSSLKDFMFANGSRSFTILPNRIHLSFWAHFDPWIPPLRPSSFSTKNLQIMWINTQTLRICLCQVDRPGLHLTWGYFNKHLDTATFLEQFGDC